MYGYHGSALYVDLTCQQARIDPLDPGLLRRLLGGVGLGIGLLLTHSPRQSDPYSADSPIIFTSGPLCGTSVAASSKFAVACKSPLTGFIGDSLSSGPAAQELTRMPFDALVITGKSGSPVYLEINNEDVSFHSAEGLVGLPAGAASQRVKDSLGQPDAGVISIGPAGEALVRFACITSGGRQAGRTGAGAVMGFKNLKAIALKGTESTTVAHPSKLAKVAERIVDLSRGLPTAKYRGPGTVANLSILNEVMALPSYNFQRSSFEREASISGHSLQKRLVDGGEGNGALRDWEHVFSARGKDGAKVKNRVEYESLFALGPLCGIDDPDAIIRATALCDTLGIDTISTGGTVAWAMESFERGLLSTSDTNGIELRFGNGEALLSVVELIGRREGIGELLAEGSKRAAEMMGEGSENWAMNVKGLEMPGYDPRSLKTLALGIAVSARGACHNRSSAYDYDLKDQSHSTLHGRGHSTLDRGTLAAQGEDFSAVLDSLILSKFLRNCFTDFHSEAAHIYELVTGWETSGEQLRRVGERIHNLRKAFNLRQGWTRADDTLPPRIFEASQDGRQLARTELDAMVEDYYRARGWTADGRIPREKLRELDILDLLGADPVSASAPGGAGG